MKQHIELGIIVAMSAMMVFGAAAFVMPYVYAASSSTGSGGSSAPGASGASAAGTKGGAGGKGDNPGSTTTGGSTTGSGSSSPPPKNPPPKNPPPTTGGGSSGGSKVPFCNPHGCKGDPGYYTKVGHHHCFDGYPGCVCTTPSKCGVAYGGKT
jgi:hypothetical protein